MRPAGTTTAVVVDEYSLLLDTVERLARDAGVTVVGTTVRAGEAGALLREHEPDVFVLGLDRRSRRADLVRALVRVAAEVGAVTIVVADDDDRELAEQCLAAGAYAYVLKTVEPADLSVTIRQAIDRSVYLFARPALTDRPPTGARRAGAAGTLTSRELDVLRLVAEGLRNAEVARRLWISEPTVKFHLSRIYEKLGVSNRTGAVRRVLRDGLLADEESLTV